MGSIAVAGQPGKTTPRLLIDLLEYDPHRAAKNRKNLLADPAEQYKPSKPNALPPIRRSSTDCQHTLIRKDGQSFPPSSDSEIPTIDSKFSVAAYCKHCRYHFGIHISFKRSKHSKGICCRGQENPLHHLLLEESLDIEARKAAFGETKYNNVTESHRFVCSVAACQAEVYVNISPPKLSKQFLCLLEDPKEVDSRGRRVMAEDPTRYDGQQPMTPGGVLCVLSHYLRDAKNKDPQEMKKIAIRNKKFRICFADECDKLFEYLDFTRYEEFIEDDDKPNVYWKLPEVTEVNRNFIDDVSFEIYQRIDDRPIKDQLGMTYAPIPALRDIERSLGFYDYPTRSRAIQIDVGEEHPYYASLGATENFTDQYLIWAYEQQVRCDPSNKPYYFDCLEDIAKGRSSADLEERVLVARSLGEMGQKEIDGAYKYFAVNPQSTEGDDHIIGVFNSRVEAAPLQKDEAREHLLVIGKARNSQKIQYAATDRTMTHDEALTYLGVTADTPADMVGSQAVVMADEAADRGRVAGALRAISKNRGGDFTLENFATTIDGNGQLSLSIEDAYTRLQVKAEMPDETIWMYYSNLCGGAGAGSKDSYTEALRAIVQHRQSAFLLAKLGNPDADIQALPAAVDQPVGLDNIGNTCYLNSLLQYYYTVKTVRDEVVFDSFQHRMALTSEDISKKRVGGRLVVRSEIVKAQKFVDELHNLFKQLKTAPTRSVKPTQELAELTMFSSAAEANFRRNPISSPAAASSNTLMIEPISGPEGPPPPMPERPSPSLSTPFEEDIEMINADAGSLDQADDSSEATLVNYEKGKSDEVPNAPSIEHTITEAKNDLDGDAVMVDGGPLTPPQSPLDKPPPIPPRNKSNLSIQTQETKLNDGIWKFGTQQDVTEVIGNVLFRLQCAIKPTSIDEDGGQRDVVKDTFYGSNAVYLQKASKLERKVEEWNSLIVPPAPSGPRDIYDALDIVFDEQAVEVDNMEIPQFASIHKLPPILQIWINRTDFDQIKQVAWKNTNPIIFPETLYLDRYMDGGSDTDLMDRRREAWLWKRIVRRLEARLQVLDQTEASLPLGKALSGTRDLLASLQTDEDSDIAVATDLPARIDERIVELEQEREKIVPRLAKYRKKLLDQFSNLQRQKYRLHSVFIHRGEASGGHYWIYIYDFEKDIWREYNDDHVSIVQDRKRIFEGTGINGTPYFLSYVKSPDLVNAVHREVDSIQAPTAEAEAILPSGPVWMDFMENDIEGEVEHVEQAKAVERPLLPKPPPGNADSSKFDAHGKGNPW